MENSPLHVLYCTRWYTFPVCLPCCYQCYSLRYYQNKLAHTAAATSACWTGIVAAICFSFMLFSLVDTVQPNGRIIPTFSRYTAVRIWIRYVRDFEHSTYVYWLTIISRRGHFQLLSIFHHSCWLDNVLIGTHTPVQGVATRLITNHFSTWCGKTLWGV